jgi:RHS repeat-associated protein
MRWADRLLRHALHRGYDLAGDMTSVTNGVTNPGILISYGYDPNDHLSTVTSSWDDALHPSTLYSAETTGACGSSTGLPSYDAGGQLQFAQMAINSQTQQAAMSMTRCYDNRLRPTSETVLGEVVAGVPASLTVTVSGTEQSLAGSGVPAQATATISFTDSGAQVMGPHPLFLANSITLPGGYHTGFVTPVETAIGVANSLASVLNEASSPVTAVVSAGGTASAATLVLTSKATGAEQNGAITLTLTSPVVKAAAGSMSGGAGTIYDTGTVTANINGAAVSASYGQGSTAPTVAQGLASAISAAGLAVTASATGAALTVTSTAAGTAGDGVAVTLSSVSDQPTFFPAASFSGGSGTLSGGAAGSPGTIYGYNIPAPGATTGYDATGNLLSYSDCPAGGTCVTGAWGIGYDKLNRVSGASASSGPWGPADDELGLSLSWMYDPFGNRETQTPTGAPHATVPQAQTLGFTGNKNQVDNYGPNGYDPAGNVLNDLTNQYAYDGEGRICAVYNPYTGYTQYIYDGEGRRVAKGTINSLSCNTGSNGFAPTESYLLGPSGEHISELDGSGNFLRSHVYANGQLLATYANGTTEFPLGDWLGTKRVVANPDGTMAGTCINLPFGDELICNGNVPVNGHHFTGQVHDQETGNEYFGARYYGSWVGRFMSPDPSGLTYANPYNPQSLNLYSYVLNNPLINIDPTGKDCVYLNDAANGIEEIDADSDTSASDCGSTGGTHVNGSLTGYGSTDPDGTINEFYSNAYGTQNGSQNGMPNPSTWPGFWNYLGSFLNGSGPTNVLYGPGNTATQQMQNTQNVQAVKNQYAQAACPGTPGSPAALQQGHLAAYMDSATNSPANPTQIEVGGYSGGVYTVNGTTTFTINNPSSMSSLDGESALNGTHSTDNPMGPTGAGHTVNQTFQWTEAGLCGH